VPAFGWEMEELRLHVLGHKYEEIEIRVFRKGSRGYVSGEWTTISGQVEVIVHQFRFPILRSGGKYFVGVHKAHGPRLAYTATKFSSFEMGDGGKGGLS